MRNVLHRMTVALPMLLLLVAGCAVTESRPGPTLDSNGSWVLLPIQNYSGTPQAGERAEVLLAAMLHQRGFKRLEHYPATTGEDALPELDERRRYTRAFEWARSRGASWSRVSIGP